MSNHLDPDQDQCSVSPDLDSTCLQRLLVDIKSLLARKELKTTSSEQWDCSQNKGFASDMFFHKLMSESCVTR